ncbi:MAG: nanoRNase/pAp phosphatase (c-di-AMP/oligoRNAs hydrolase) [Chlamydiales bacterium]|jgi:nanoRNase/pAp phosphatase (c-di-AMP/oligoRNAs hydrolase)
MSKQTLTTTTEADHDVDSSEAHRISTGQYPVHHLREVLEQASASAPAAARGRFLVLTHRGPDPDALGACEGLRCLLSQGFGYEVVVATLGRIHRAENLALVRTLDLDLAPYSSIDPEKFAGATLVDTQPEFGHTVLPKDIPIIAVFDHHVPPKPDAKNGNGSVKTRPPILHRDVRLELGATCSMIYEYLRDAGVEPDLKTASALFCGVRYDTADLSRNATELDEEAYHETFRKADRDAIAKIGHPPLPRDYYLDLHQALTIARQHGPLVLALLGKVDNPESVAEMADFFLRMKGCSWVVVGGAFEGEYVLSLRTDYAFGKAYPLMRRVLDGVGSFGGHGHIAGGRITLDDGGESTIKCVERVLRANALAVIGATDEEDSIPPEGRPLA